MKVTAIVVKDPRVIQNVTAKVKAISGSESFCVAEIATHFPTGFTKSHGQWVQLHGKPTHAVFSRNSKGHWIITGVKQDLVLSV